MSCDVAPAYVRHKPEQTLLYQLVEQYWLEFQAQLNETGRFLPRHVTREFEDCLACGRLETGFLRVRCHSCSHEHLVAFSCTNSRRFRRTTLLLHQLWCQTYGGDSRAFGRSCFGEVSCAYSGEAGLGQDTARINICERDLIIFAISSSTEFEIPSSAVSDKSCSIAGIMFFANAVISLISNW